MLLQPMKDYGLKPCPFCGSTKLKIEHKSSPPSKHYHNRVRHYTYSVRCNVCFARGGAVGGDVLEMNTTTLDIFEPCVTKEDLIKQAVDNWNTRCNDGAI